MPGLLLILLVLSGFIGCITQPPAPERPIYEKENSATIPPTLETSGTATPTIPTQLNERRFWTEIEPIPDVEFGRDANITVNGTTNLPSGENISVEFFARSMHPSPMVYYPELHFITVTEVRGGDKGINTWSVTIPTQRFEKPDQYSVMVVDQRGYSITGDQTIMVTP